MSLFNLGEFKLHSGGVSRFKIDCDALTDDDLAAMAEIAADLLPPFFTVEGVARGGLRFAEALRKHVATGPSFSAYSKVCVADDVGTTGRSMEAQRAGRDACGVVIFARGRMPAWVTPLFQLWWTGK